jgi:hypothetical protein
MVLLFALCLSQGERLIADPDVYWHVETGRYVLEHGFPRVDIFSHTAGGQPWIDMEWLSQVVMALVFDTAGFGGLVVLGGCLIVLTWCLLVRYLERSINAWAALAVASASIWFASFHFLMRPHLFALPILVVWTGELVRGRASPWLAPLFLLWVQLHGSFILGIMVACGLGFPLLGALAAVWALANPYGLGYYEMVWWQIAHMDVMRHTIAELRPVSPYLDIDRVAVLIAALAFMLWRGYKLSLMSSMTLCGLLFMALQHWRGMAFFAVVAPLILARAQWQQK